MDVFQPPLEALVLNFNYVSLGFLPTTTVQSLLTCLALLTALVSFWRIKAVGTNSSFHRTKSSSSSSGDGDGDGDDDFPPTFHFDDGHSSTPPLPLSTTLPPHHLGSEKKPSQQQHHKDACSSTCNSPIEDDEDDDSNGNLNGESCRVKGKFTLYYSKEQLDKIGEEDPIDDVDVNCSSGCPELLYSNVGRCWCCDGIGIWVRRSGRGDLGWYRYQDLTVLNGSVVKMWECHRR